MRRGLFFFCLFCSLAVSAKGDWYAAQNAPSQNKIDVLYLVSTNVLTLETAKGKMAFRSQLTPADRELFRKEMAFVEKNIAQDDFNFFAPYYHQFVMDATLLPKEYFQRVYKKVTQEVWLQFDDYMKHQNNGRPFVLVGFSQGAMMVKELLCRMSDKQYKQLVAAYMLGYRLNKQDLQQKHIRAAQDASEPGVTVSFNTALSENGIWPLVAADAATCINPVNWTTTPTPASFDYEGHQQTLSVDTIHNILILQTDQPDVCRQWSTNPIVNGYGVPADCLHLYDLLFYPQFIHDNILQRSCPSKK